MDISDVLAFFKITWPICGAIIGMIVFYFKNNKLMSDRLEDKFQKMVRELQEEDQSQGQKINKLDKNSVDISEVRILISDKIEELKHGQAHTEMLLKNINDTLHNFIVESSKEAIKNTTRIDSLENRLNN